MTFEDLGLHEDVRQFVRELDTQRRDVSKVKREEVKVETKTLTGKAAQMYDESLRRTITRVNPNSSNTNPNAP